MYNDLDVTVETALKNRREVWTVMHLCLTRFDYMSGRTFTGQAKKAGTQTRVVVTIILSNLSRLEKVSL